MAGVAPCEFETTETPAGWDTIEFDASHWPAATEHNTADVSPKMGYDDITWDASATFIWGPDLKTDNTVLCRLLVE